MPVDCHMHTPLCGHAYGEPVSFVDAAAQAGIGLITFTCHLPMAHPRMGGPGIRMRPHQLSDYLGLVEGAREHGRARGVEVLCGIESEYFPDPQVMEEVDRELGRHGWDFVLGSLHASLPAYEDRFVAHCQSDEERVELYFSDLAEAAKSDRYDSMSHLDVVRLYGVIQSFNPAAHEKSIRRALESCADHGRCIEINTSGFIKAVSALHPDPLILGWASEAGVKLTLGSDSHRPEQVGQHFGRVLPLLRELGFSSVNYFRNRRRCAVRI